MTKKNLNNFHIKKNVFSITKKKIKNKPITLLKTKKIKK